MGLWDRVTAALALAPWDHPRVELSLPIEEQFFALRAERRAAPRPWRTASVRDALSVPAIFGAVTLISNVCATLTLRGLRDGVEMPAGERPRVIVRPNPFTTTRDFLRETVWPMAVYGEAWWWVSARSRDDMASSLVPVDPREVTVEATYGDWLRPDIRWRGKLMDRRDMVQIVCAKEPGGLRGFGPLQMCGAAISISVEAQEWAANFYSEGGFPSVYLRPDVDFADEDEATKVKEKWTANPPNTPQVISPGLEVGTVPVNEQGAQMLEARTWNVGDVARMFSVPGSLLEFAREGASLTYQNVTSEFDKLMKACLLPNYLEPIEQAMSDLLPRAITTRFNQDALLRADVKTRYEVYGIGIDKGILTAEEARTKEGLAGGDIENAPVPISPPSSVPDATPIRLPLSRGLRNVDCPTCSRLVGRVEGRGELWCRHCKVVVAA